MHYFLIFGVRSSFHKPIININIVWSRDFILCMLTLFYIISFFTIRLSNILYSLNFFSFDTSFRFLPRLNAMWERENQSSPGTKPDKVFIPKWSCIWATLNQLNKIYIFILYIIHRYHMWYTIYHVLYNLKIRGHKSEKDWECKG